MKLQYEMAERMEELYHLLSDKLSKDIFWARLQFDCDRCFENEIRLFRLTGYATEENIETRMQLREISLRLKAEGKKLFLYGAATSGAIVGSMLLKQGGDFFAYCARSHEKYTNGVNGKPVYSPDYIFEHPEECYVLIASTTTASEIYDILLEHHFPKEQIYVLSNIAATQNMLARQYFEFPELFPKGKAFVDGGCFDCETSKKFAVWCGDEYSKIFAFEPDPKNYQKCLDISDSSNLRLKLIPSGLSEEEGTVRFAGDRSGGSFVIESTQEEQSALFNMNRGKVVASEIVIQTVRLDDAVKDEPVGFIKMDIEGSELSALHGAERTILRDKPLMAICVYHRCGDVLAIMDYLNNLVPEYRFWLRQYSMVGTETVLYASI